MNEELVELLNNELFNIRMSAVYRILCNKITEVSTAIDNPHYHDHDRNEDLQLALIEQLDAMNMLKSALEHRAKCQHIDLRDGHFTYYDHYAQQ